MLTLTEMAAKKISDLRLEEGKPEWGLRIRVVGGGCSGMSYELGWDDTPVEGNVVDRGAGSATAHGQSIELVVVAKEVAGELDAGVAQRAAAAVGIVAAVQAVVFGGVDALDRVFAAIDVDGSITEQHHTTPVGGGAASILH
jgi:Fe-S cluster assembly iron-binding protein IscA